MDRKEIHVISHTHWDREWYLPFEQFRIKLVKLIDHLLDILDKTSEYKHFTLDGHAILLEDYLEIQPEKKDKLRDYIEKGRILIGPWYILPDEFLVSGESLIRNLLLGERICRRFGRKMNVGYLVDMFGHTAQMPQILKGFGIKDALLWRGIDNEVRTTEFIWEAPDGSDVLTVYMPFGYCAAGSLPSDSEGCLCRIRNLVAKLSPMGTTNVILLMNGCDHLEPQPNLATIINKVNTKMGDMNIIHSNLGTFFKKIRQECLILPHFRKEWRSGERAPIMGGVLSSRMYLKQANHFLENLLEKWVEPFSSLAWLTGTAYPCGLIWQAWKYLLQNQSHDSIGGSSIDEVHEEMMVRFTKAKQIGEELCNQALSFLTKRININEENLSFVIFNPLSHKRTDVVDLIVDVDEQLVKYFNWETVRGEEVENLPRSEHYLARISISDAQGQIVPSFLKKVERVKKLKLSPHNLPQVYLTNRCYISLLARNVPSLGYKVYYFNVGDGTEPKVSRELGALVLENEYFRVIPASNGSLSIFDKKTKTLYQRCNTFVDGGDAGDEYTYSPPARDTIISTVGRKAHITWQESGSVTSTLRIETSLHLPINLTEDGQERSEEVAECSITSYVSLSKELRRIDIRTVVENRMRNHRLRALFPCGIQTDTSYSEGAFHVISRSVEPPKSDVGREELVGTNPQKSFVDVNNGRIGLAIANRGLPEYEIVEEDGKAVIALTLLRSIGAISQKGLLTRKGLVGPPISTPNAQCIGRYEFFYSIIPHRGDWRKGRILQEAIVTLLLYPFRRS